MADDVDAEKFVSPPYTAVMECAPPASAEILSVATPPDNVPVPSEPVPSIKVTIPVTFEGVTVAVKVTELP